MLRVYIASPYTVGDVAVNVRNSFDAAAQLIASGFAPYTPLWTHFLHLIHPQTYKTWMRLDAEWLQICDAVLRLPGESSGADHEVLLAETLGIPVFYAIEAMEEKAAN